LGGCQAPVFLARTGAIISRGQRAMRGTGASHAFSKHWRHYRVSCSCTVGVRLWRDVMKKEGRKKKNAVLCPPFPPAAVFTVLAWQGRCCVVSAGRDVLSHLTSTSAKHRASHKGTIISCRAPSACASLRAFAPRCLNYLSVGAARAVRGIWHVRERFSTYQT